MSLVCWRIAREIYADLAGRGAFLTGGRWNSPGKAVVYTALEASLAILEVRVHLDLTADLLPEDYVLMRIEATSPPPIERVESAPADARAFGDEWLMSGRTAALDVPSAIVPESRNLLINPVHPMAAHFTLATKRSFVFDSRLWLGS